MTEPHGIPSQDRSAANARRGVIIAVACAAFAVGMVGAAFASVPLYRLFCQVTGYGGTTQRAEAAAGAVSEKSVTIRFDANVAAGLPWTFSPNEREVRVKLGATHQTSYHVKNTTDRTLSGQALFNVTPEAAGVYFNKIDCFCFNSQTLKPGEEADMGVLFFIDPAMLKAEELKDAPAITLSYTFFPIDNPDPVAQVPEDGARVKKGRDS